MHFVYLYKFNMACSLLQCEQAESIHISKAFSVTRFCLAGVLEQCGNPAGESAGRFSLAWSLLQCEPAE